VLFVVRRGQSLIGKKTMRADELTCSEFEAAVALAIASALEAVVPAALEPNAVTSPIIAATAPPSSALAPPVVAAVEGVKRAPFRHRVALGAELATAAGYLMAPAALLSPSLELRVLERFDLRLAIALTADQSRALGTGIVTMQTAFGALSACYVVLTSPSPVRLRGCVGLSVGGTGAEAHGYLTNSAAIAPWAGLDAGLDVRWPADAPLALIVGLRGDVVAVPPTFAVEAVGVVRTNPVAGGGFVGLQLVLPP
jgi:hypothetical protein